MENVYSMAYQEVYSVMNIMPKDLLDKIPIKFRDMIDKKRSKNYNVNIQTIEDIENANFKEETIIILGLMYRDFLCSPEEKKELQLEDLKLREEEREKYNPDNIFKDEKIQNIQNEVEEVKENVSLTEVKEKSLFARFIDKIKSFFRKGE